MFENRDILPVFVGVTKLQSTCDGDVDDCHKYQECKLWLHPGRWWCWCYKVWHGQFCNMLESYYKVTQSLQLDLVTQQSISTLFVNHLAPGCQNWYWTQAISMKLYYSKFKPDNGKRKRLEFKANWFRIHLRYKLSNN